MATPLTLKAIETECRRLGLSDIRWVPRAATADRPGTFAPIGITIHITAGGLKNRSEESYIRDIINGDPKVPLKANAVTAPDGTLWLNAQGNTNHCLYYGPAAMTATRNATFPLSGNANYRGSLMKWSLYAYGNEMIAASGAKVTATQRRSAVIWAAAIARLHGWTGQETHGHGEVAYDRSHADPGINMGQFRRDVMALVKDKATTPPKDTTPKPQPTPKDWFDMATEAQLKKIVETAVDRRLGDVIPVPDYVSAADKKGNPTWQATSVLSYILSKTHRAEQNSAAALEVVKTLAKRSGPLSTAEVEAAVKRGLESIITDADVTLNVQQDGQS